MVSRLLRDEPGLVGRANKKGAARGPTPALLAVSGGIWGVSRVSLAAFGVLQGLG